MNKQKGACFCGAVKYELNSEILHVVNCHCDFCRSHSGAAFSTYAALPYTALEITQGTDKLSRFEIEEGAKHFCSVCGTPIFNLNEKYPGACMLYFGTLESARNIQPKVNIWCESLLPWVGSVTAIKSLDQAVESKKI